MIFLNKAKFIVLIIVIATLSVAGYFYFSKKFIDIPIEKRATPAKNESFTNNEKYVREKVKEFLVANPKADIDYATDIVYHNIAVKEKNITICDKIESEYWKNHCYRLMQK